jgi:hypothetical protein
MRKCPSSQIKIKVWAFSKNTFKILQLWTKYFDLKNGIKWKQEKEMKTLAIFQFNFSEAFL